jgi:hypothetical protein
MPRPLVNEPKAVELARIWAVAGGGQHVSLTTKIIPDPAAWGILLVNLAKHVAMAYQQTKGLDANETLNRIKSAFDSEWTSPTDKPTGEVIRQPPSEK